MIKIVKSLLVIIAVAAIAAFSTHAYFTDQKAVENNIFTAGDITISITGSGSSALNFSAMAPGVWTEQKEYEVNNIGTLAAKYQISSTMVSESVAGYYDLINARVRTSTDGTPIWQGALKDLAVTSVGGLGDLTVGATHTYYVDFQLDPTADNTYEGANAIANFVFDATQTNNPGWSE